jgi:hypothetical protein
VGRAARADHFVDPAEQQSIALSPLVVAVPRTLRDHWPHTDAALQWRVDQRGGGGQIELHVGRAASSSTAGLLTALKAAADQQPDPRAALTGLLRAVRVDAALGEDSREPPAPGSSTDAVVPVAEQAVFQHTGAPQVTAVYPRAAGTPFDYPFTILSAEGGSRRTADQLLTALGNPEAQALLRAAGFRGEDGTGAGLTPDRGVDGTQPGTVAVPDVVTVDDLLKTLAAVQQNARVFAVVDVSGSMAPTTLQRRRTALGRLRFRHRTAPEPCPRSGFRAVGRG